MSNFGGRVQGHNMDFKFSFCYQANIIEKTFDILPAKGTLNKIFGSGSISVGVCLFG